MGDTGPIIRILLRYVAGYLVFKAVLPKEMGDMLANDPELVGVIGAGIALAVEAVYVMAKKFGWRK